MSRSLWLALLLSIRLIAVATANSIADGDAALQKFNLDGALASYRNAYSNAPTNYEAAWKLSCALVNKGTLTKTRADQKTLFAEAEQTARDAVRLNPKDSKGHTYLAIAVGKLALFEGSKQKSSFPKKSKSKLRKRLP